MTKRRLLQLLAVLFAFSLVAAACGDSDGDDSAGDGGEQTDDGNQTAAEATTTTEEVEAPDAIAVKSHDLGPERPDHPTHLMRTSLAKDHDRSAFRLEDQLGGTRRPIVS